MDKALTLRAVSERIAHSRFAEAEQMLTEALAQARNRDNRDDERMLLSELIELYCVKDPPETERAEGASIERERLDPSAQSKWQTAMLLYWHKHAPDEALVKSNEAMDIARRSGASAIAYSSLALSGLAFLDLGRDQEAQRVLGEIERMVLRGDSFVVGDEALFLERAATAGIDAARIVRIASALIPRASDPTVATQLRKIVNG